MIKLKDLPFWQYALASLIFTFGGGWLIGGKFHGYGGPYFLNIIFGLLVLYTLYKSRKIGWMGTISILLALISSFVIFNNFLWLGFSVFVTPVQLIFTGIYVWKRNKIEKETALT